MMFRIPASCADVPTLVPPERFYPNAAAATGWLSLTSLDPTRAPILNASIDAEFGDPSIPTAQIRIENMDLGDREGWIVCPF